MKIVGRIQLTGKQSFRLAAGGTVDLPLGQFREFVRPPAKAGDLVWVQEPYCCFTPKQYFYDTEIQPGPMSRPPFWRNKPVKRPAPPGERRFSQEPAKYLRRKDSTTTLEIMGLTAEGQFVRCLVHPKNVDVLAKEMAAA